MNDEGVWMELTVASVAENLSPAPRSKALAITPPTPLRITTPKS